MTGGYKDFQQHLPSHYQPTPRPPEVQWITAALGGERRLSAIEHQLKAVEGIAKANRTYIDKVEKIAWKALAMLALSACTLLGHAIMPSLMRTIFGG